MDTQLDTFSKMQAQLAALQKMYTTERDSHLKNLCNTGMEYVYQGMGLGSYEHQLATGLSKFNRFGLSHGNHNYLKYGHIFITRPHLNLNAYNLKSDRILNLLNTTDPNNIRFAIRIMLDTESARGTSFLKIDEYGREEMVNITGDLQDRAMRCPYVDWRSPFFTWITNNITDFSGGPNYQLEVDQDSGGYFGEQQSLALANSTYKKPFDLSISVDDPYGGPIDAALFYWTYVMQQQYLGTIVAYPQDINDQLLNYTVSIYRFIMDFSGQYIQRAYKYTGCFPISRPGASVADFSKDQPFVEQARHFTMAFRCGSGNVDERDPIIIKEFNDLCERYYPPFADFPIANGIKKNKDATTPNLNVTKGCVFKSVEEIDEAIAGTGVIRNPVLPDFNYTGVPYIMFTARGPRLDFYREQDEYTADSIKKKLNEHSTEIWKINQKYSQLIGSIINNYYNNTYGSSGDISLAMGGGPTTKNDITYV